MLKVCRQFERELLQVSSSRPERITAKRPDNGALALLRSQDAGRASRSTATDYCRGKPQRKIVVISWAFAICKVLLVQTPVFDRAMTGSVSQVCGKLTVSMPAAKYARPAVRRPVSAAPECPKVCHIPSVRGRTLGKGVH